MHVQRDAGVGLQERAGEGVGVDLAAAREGLQVDVVDVNQRLASPYTAGLSFGSLYILNCR
jgi:hypothetical protein